MRIALSGLSVGEHLGTLKAELEPFHLTNDLFLGEVMLNLADAIENGRVTRTPIEFATIRERYLPESGAHTKEQHYKVAGSRSGLPQ